MIKLAADGEFLECSCGNDVMDSGFYPVNANGEEVEPIAYSSDSEEVRHSWDGKMWKCGRCGVVEEVEG
jgi:hypothetical protein